MKNTPAIYIFKKLLLVLLVVLNQVTVRSQPAKLQMPGAVIDSYPSLSPDNKKIAFESNRNSNFDIYTMDIDGRNINQLTRDTAFDGTPSWPPDGRSIVFASERNRNSEIYIMRSDGVNQKRITYDPGDDSHPHFSPDGRLIFFCSERNITETKPIGNRKITEIFSMNPDGSNVNQISFFKSVCTFPTESPDGMHIAFRRVLEIKGIDWNGNPSETNSEIFVMDIDGSHPVDISNSPAFDGWPVWTSDSRHVIFASARNSPPHASQLFICEIKGDTARQLTFGPFSFAAPFASADGKKITAYRFFETADYEPGGIAIWDTKEF